MKNRMIIICLALLLGPSIACRTGEKKDGAQAFDTDNDVKAIKASMAEFVELYNAGDFEKIMSAYYAENAIQVPPDGPVRKGRAAILLGFRKDRELNDEHIDVSLVEDVAVSGDLAVARGMDAGTTTPKDGGTPAKYLLNWLIVLERQSDGAWKWKYEIWNVSSGL